MKLKALLVDDEVHILNNLSKVLPWEDMGFEIAGLARNGVEALEAAILHAPDLILCDIRMPVMDGLEFIEKAREHKLNSEIILLTGYQEFEYARVGIKYGVKDYICKPINYFELEDVVRSIAAHIREARRKQNKEEWLEQAAMLFNENYMLHALLGQMTDERMQWLPDEERGEQPSVDGMLLLDLEDYARCSLSWTPHERKTWNVHIKRLLTELFRELVPNCMVLQVREGEWCLVLHSAEWQSVTREQLAEMHTVLMNEVRKTQPELSLRMCVKQESVPLRELPALYQRMQKLFILHSPDEWIVDADSLLAERNEIQEMDVEDDGMQGWRFTELMTNGLRNGNPDMLLRVSSELKQYIARSVEGSGGHAEKLLHYLLIHLLREMRELQMLAADQEKEVWTLLQGTLSLKGLLTVILAMLDQSRDSLAAKKSSETLMMTAQNYILQHLGKDFGIEDISDYLGISCSYFCLLFKNHFGETFVEYLTRQRIETAKTLLQSSSKSITSIGAVVGYQERRYFTKVFQKYTGMTPSEYRSRESTVS
ncbi:hypothetical protein J41TS12_36210 [Paenibacillus antibioticophila]|uniref:Response regulator n=1 Tax=Paenibacillus antibioticophila TaxID=1274374 RepID=A0A919XXM7_9BACL|nr:response regulator [Paenibacillus antibioticophila]GIO38760.1 hypothetical protein J41TS12_36210 [Paenibacillus antibioticophila]